MISAGEIKIRVENDHIAEDFCSLNSTAVTIIQENNFGYVNNGDIEIRGGEILK